MTSTVRNNFPFFLWGYWGEERDVKALAVKTEKDPQCYQNIKNSLKLSESVQMNGHRWMLHDQGHSHV